MEAYQTPCKICPSCGGHGRIVCGCVPHNVPVDEMIGDVECARCGGDGDYQCLQCSGSGAVQRCSCDDIGESPCPAHHRENALQNQVLELQAEIEAWKDASGLECGGDPDGVTPKAAAEYWANIERIAQQRDDAVNSFLNCRQDLEYCKHHAHQSAAYICAKVASEYETTDNSIAGMAWSDRNARAETARQCEKVLRDSTPEGWPGGRLQWVHTNVEDGDLPRIEAWPEHRTRPHFTVQMRKPYGQEMASADVCMTHSEPNIDDFEYCIAEFSISFRDDLETCSRCGGNMRHQGIAGVVDCPWCDGQGVSVMDESMKMVNWIYNSWLTTRTLARDDILCSAKHSTRLTDDPVNSGSCNDGELRAKRERS